MPLDELQKRFANGVVKLDIAELKDVIVADTQISIADRLEVYHHNIVGGLVAALAGTFSATRALVGDAYFSKMASAYVKGHLPQSANLNLYGADFPAYVKGFVNGQKLPYLGDVARFEWAWNEVFLAPDETPVNPELFTRMDETALHKLTFSLLASVQLFSSSYPVDELYRFAESTGQGNSPVMEGNVKLMLFRPQTEVMVLRLKPVEFEVLERFSRGNSVAQMVDYLSTQDGDFNLEEFLTKCFILAVFK